MNINISMDRPNVTVEIECLNCGRIHSVVVPKIQFYDWYDGAAVSKAFPDLGEHEKNSLLHQLCNSCQDSELYKHEDKSMYDYGYHFYKIEHEESIYFGTATTHEEVYKLHALLNTEEAHFVVVTDWGDTLLYEEDTCIRKYICPEWRDWFGIK